MHLGSSKIKTFLLAGFFLSQNALASQECPPCPCRPCCPSWWDRGWNTTVYSGPLTTNNNSDIFFSGKFKSEATIAVLAGAKELGSVWDHDLDFEWEAQAVTLLRGKAYFDINPIVLVLRWNSFPWNKSLPTTLAIGDGISIATSTPKVEVAARGRRETARVLNYVMAEITFSHPCYPQWAFVGRYHHRSGVFGTFSGVWDASTAFAAGLKYWF